MSDLAKTVGPDFVAASVRHLDGLLGSLAAYLDAVEARVGALERRLSAVPLMTAADAARYARVKCGDRTGQMWRRSCAWSGPASFPLLATLATRLGSLAMPSAVGLPRGRPRRHRPLRRPAGVAVERQAVPSSRHGRRWGECRGPARSQRGAPPRTPPTGHVMDELDHAPRLAAVDAIMEARSGPPPERLDLTVSSA